MIGQTCECVIVTSDPVEECPFCDRDWGIRDDSDADAKSCDLQDEYDDGLDTGLLTLKYALINKSG